MNATNHLAIPLFIQMPRLRGGAKLLCANLHLIFADTAAREQGSYLHLSLLAN